MELKEIGSVDADWIKLAQQIPVAGPYEYNNKL
jgi:hypothetical protein